MDTSIDLIRVMELIKTVSKLAIVKTLKSSSLATMDAHQLHFFVTFIPV